MIKNSTTHFLKRLFAGLLVATFLLQATPFSARAQTQALIVPFGGYLTNVDYMTCNCGFVIFTLYDKTAQTTYTIIWFYLAQLLADLGVPMPDALKAVLPRVYAFGAIWPGSDASVVGNFIRYENAVCLYITNSGCATETPGADGYLWNMGTSLYGTGN